MALDRRTGFKLMQLGFWLVFVALVALLWPKYGQKVTNLLLPDRLRPDHQAKPANPPAPPAAPVPEAKAWDPSKEALPPGMKPAK